MTTATLPSTDVVAAAELSAATLSRVVLDADLSPLSPAQRLEYMTAVCRTMGLSIATKPFEFINLQGKLRMYARKDATDQLRRIHRVAITIASRETVGDCYVVSARASTPDGRTDESLGAVPIKGLAGENLANAWMKAETKAKRRVTLSICGLGMLDESELGSVDDGAPRAQTVGEQARAAALAAGDAALKRGAEQSVDAEAAARAAVAKVAAEAAAKPKWMLEAEALAPKADARTLAAFDAGTLNAENSTRAAQGDALLPVGAAERAAIRLRMAPRTERLKELAPAILKELKAQHATDFLALDAAVRDALRWEEQKQAGTKAAAADPELSEAVVVPDADEGSTVG